jgi:hypothetical protein
MGPGSVRKGQFLHLIHKSGRVCRVAQLEVEMFSRASILLLAIYTPGIMLAAQTPAGTMQATNSPATARAVPPSVTLQPSLDVLKQALSEMSIDKWKASPAIRTEADSNLKSIQRDIQTTLPALLSTADAAPDSVAKTLPVFRNIDALYDVMLRLDAAGRLAAPKDQMSALDQALAGLSDVRRTLGDQVQANAETQETRVNRLQAQLRAVPPPPPAAPVACTPPTPAKKKVTKPAAKKTSPPANSQTAAPSH